MIILLFCLMAMNSFAGERLAYHSDYFSFIGRDAVGFVAFALDNNRGVEGSHYQAEHFGVLYDQKSGWERLVSRRNQGNWIIGGFAMSVVEGELLRSGDTIPVLGFAELIK